MSYADLHIHTTASDGQHTPAQVVALARKAGVHVIAITDHDTLAGIAPAQQAASDTELTVVAGVECTVQHEDYGFHLLGYGMDTGDPDLHAHFEAYADARIERARAIVRKLRTTCHIEIGWADVEAHVPDAAVVARPHIAAALCSIGAVDTPNEAFERFIGNRAAAYVPLPHVSASQMVTWIQDAGGMTSIAHPGHWMPGAVLHQMVEAGLDAIECVHPSHDASLEAYYRNRVHRWGLSITGGSDFHGQRRAGASKIGEMGISRSAWERIAAVCT